MGRDVLRARLFPHAFRRSGIGRLGVRGQLREPAARRLPVPGAFRRRGPVGRGLLRRPTRLRAEDAAATRRPGEGGRRGADDRARHRRSHPRADRGRIGRRCCDGHGWCRGRDARPGRRRSVEGRGAGVDSLQRSRGLRLSDRHRGLRPAARRQGRRGQCRAARPDRWAAGWPAFPARPAPSERDGLRRCRRHEGEARPAAPRAREAVPLVERDERALRGAGLLGQGLLRHRRREQVVLPAAPPVGSGPVCARREGIRPRAEPRRALRARLEPRRVLCRAGLSRPGRRSERVESRPRQGPARRALEAGRLGGAGARSGPEGRSARPARSGHRRRSRHLPPSSAHITRATGSATTGAAPGPSRRGRGSSSCGGSARTRTAATTAGSTR